MRLTELKILLKKFFHASIQPLRSDPLHPEVFLQSAKDNAYTGIKQGFTLSPYLFLILMTVIFKDVHQDVTLENQLKANRPPGLDFDDVLYADDTIRFSTDEDALENL